jgi:hypothetical protein
MIQTGRVCLADSRFPFCVLTTAAYSHAGSLMVKLSHVRMWLDEVSLTLLKL